MLLCLINRNEYVKLNPNNTGKLLEQCKKGNKRAQMKLYQQFSKAMYNTAFRILGNADDAEDAVQEGFITAFEKLEEIQEVEKFPGWIKTIIMRKALTHLNRKKKTIPLYQDFGAEELQETKGGIEMNAQKNVLWQSIQKLKPNHKTILVMMYYEGMDYEEISSLMGLSNGNCRTLMSRAKEQLKKIINTTAHVS